MAVQESTARSRTSAGPIAVTRTLPQSPTIDDPVCQGELRPTLRSNPDPVRRIIDYLWNLLPRGFLGTATVDNTNDAVDIRTTRGSRTLADGVSGSGCCGSTGVVLCAPDHCFMTERTYESVPTHRQ